MRRVGSVFAALTIVIILVAVEIVIIKSASKYEPQVGVVFSKVRIPEKTSVTPDMLEVRKIGIGLVHRLSIRNAAEVSGKKALTDIEAGEMILSSRLGTDEMEDIAVVDKSNRLFSVEFKGDQANGWWLKADQTVDIIFVPEGRRKEDGPASAESPGDGTMPGPEPEGAVVLPANGVKKLSDIRIAALMDENGKLLKGSTRTSVPRYISFEVTSAQAEFLAYAKGAGRLEISVIPAK